MCVHCGRALRYHLRTVSPSAQARDWAVTLICNVDHHAPTGSATLRLPLADCATVPQRLDTPGVFEAVKSIRARQTPKAGITPAFTLFGLAAVGEQGRVAVRVARRLARHSRSRSNVSSRRQTRSNSARLSCRNSLPSLTPSSPLPRWPSWVSGALLPALVAPYAPLGREVATALAREAQPHRRPAGPTVRASSAP